MVAGTQRGKPGARPLPAARPSRRPGPSVYAQTRFTVF